MIGLVRGAWDRAERALARLESAAAGSQAPRNRPGNNCEPNGEASLEPFSGPLAGIPRNRREVYEVYGNPGVGRVDPRWERANMVVARHLPGAWNSGRGRLYVHRLAEPYLREALRRCELVGVLGYIERLGCFNFRHQRHDSSRPLSYHSWGIAVDINPGDNRARRFPAGAAPEPWSDGWWELWPDGVPRELVEAWESVGWAWGGRWETFPDPMHMQLAGA